jgi:glyoxylase-like metal-dependent hydrolase (beta-lactamase superfamily II)
MKIGRTWIAAGFAVLPATALFVAGSEAQPGTVKEIVPGVWFREGEIKDMGHCNNVIIEMKDYLIIIDANFPSGARMALADAKELSHKPVRYVFDTHHHGDHAYGNAVWTQMGAITVGHKGVVEEMKRYEPKRWQDTAKQRKDVAELNLATAEPPKETFDQRPYVLDDGTRRVEFHFFGWAHTRGDGFAWLPREKIVCTGDAIVNGPYNYMGDGNIGNWPNVVRRVRKLGATRVLPGHGGPGGVEVIDGQEKFFVELIRAVRAGIAQKKSTEELAKSIQMPDDVKNWVGSFWDAQVKYAYDEITQKKPIGEITGGK